MKNFLLIDDHAIVRSGVKILLLPLFSPCQIYEADDEKSAIACLKERAYDLVIMDVRLPDTDSFGLLEYIKINFPASRILIFSMSAENIYAKRYLIAGAMGFVSKTSGLGELQKAIELALNNRKYISCDLASRLANDFGSRVVNPFSLLSAKEFDISILMIAGHSITEISKILNISTSTVGTHKARLLEKLHIKNVMELSEMGREYNV